MTSNPMGLQQACANCPFRSDRLFFLSKPRKQEIADSLRREELFNCHKTIRYGDLDHSREMFCAGALMTMINEGLHTLPMQLGERLGLWNLDEFRKNFKIPVFDSLQSWIDIPVGRQ